MPRTPSWSPIVDGVTEIDAAPLNDIVDEISDTVDDVTALTARVAALEVPAVNTQTASYTLVLGDANKVVEMNNSSSRTITVPPNSSVAFPVGTIIEVCNINTGTVTIQAGSGVTLQSAGALVALAGQWATASLRKRATDEWVLTGELA